MSQVEQQIAHKIQEIASASTNRKVNIFSGSVVAGSVNTSELTCTVLLSIDDIKSPTECILLNSVTNSVDGLVLYPADNSNVLVAEVDGPGKYAIIRYGEITKAITTIGNTVFTISNSGYKIERGSINLTTIMRNILNHIMAITVTTSTGTSSVPVNISSFTSDLTDLNNLLV